MTPHDILDPGGLLDKQKDNLPLSDTASAVVSYTSHTKTQSQNPIVVE